MYIISGPNSLLGVNCSCILHAHSSDKPGVLDVAFRPENTVIFERVHFDDVVNRTNVEWFGAAKCKRRRDCVKLINVAITLIL